MGKDDLEEFLDMRSIMKHSIKFLNVNAEQLVDEAITHITSQEKNYSDDLDEKLQTFKTTILNTHIQWIIDHCNEFSIEFDNKYKDNIDFMIIEAYRDALRYILTILPNMQIKRKEVEENLEDHFNYLIKNT